MNKKQKQTTQEFFPRSKGAAKSDGLIFNKAPVNKNEAYKETKAKVMDEQEDQEMRRRNPKAEKGSFMTKLYRDDDEYNELKVTGMIDEDDEEVIAARADGMIKRKTKVLAKKETKTAYSSKIDSAAARIPKLALRKGGIGMFAVCEVGDDHLIVNHTRNTKGYVELAGSKLKSSSFKVGQLLIASINAEIGGADTGKIYNFASGKAGLNRKIQLSLDSVQINKNLSASTVSKSMVFQAIIESKEAKGYILNLGFRDNTKGFMKFTEQTYKKGDLVTIFVKSIDEASKVLKCDALSETNAQECVHQTEQISLTHMKPGFLVSGKISKVFENGVEINFLGGIIGTCFIDHLQEDITEYKIGKKITARIISVDTVAKKITVSMLKSIVNWTSHKPEYKIGQLVEKAKITKRIYGGSYMVDFKNGSGFLHKTQTSEAQKKQDEDSDEQKSTPKEMEVGQILDEVKVKEINYFDSKPILSIRQSLLKAEALSFDTIKCGQFFQAVIEKVVPEKNYVQLKINDFVKGNLHIEHMADNAIKQMAPKFQEVGKDIRVRVLSVNVSKRCLEFTKKDSLMKEDAPVFQSYKEVRKGDKLMGVIVSKNEFGYVVASFGGIKGMINFEDVEEKLGKNYDKNEFKTGSILKAYVLFKKKDKGCALTLSKKKAKADREEGGEQAETIETAFLPIDEEMEVIVSSDKYSTMMKASRDPEHVGQVNLFRVLEQKETYSIVKSLDASKKSKNFIALLPKCLDGSFNLNEEDFTCKGLILDQYRGQIPIVSFQQDLIELKDQILSKDQELQSGSSHIGLVNGLVGKSGAVSVRFLNGIQKLIKVKDLNTTNDYKKIYAPGKVIRVAVNKLGRLCTKSQVINACTDSTEEDKKIQINTFCQKFSKNLKEMGVQLGQEIDAQVQLVKDYGIITQIQGDNVQTGFIINDHKGGQGKYKQGQALKCVILDVDPLKKIADLSEKTFKKSDKDIKVGSTSKAIVELNKDSYLICSLKNNRKKFGICIMQNFNMDDHVDQAQIGEEIEVKVLSYSDNLYQLIPSPKVVEKKKSSNKSFELKEGIKFMGQIKSIKNSCMYIQVPSAKGIGRLHMVECPKFEQYTVGDKIEAKILKVTQENDRTWIELTRNAKHMSKAQGLDQETLDASPMKESDLKKGERYDAIIVSSTWDSQDALNLKLSEPIHIQLSPFVRGKIAFNQIVGVDELSKFGSQVFAERNFKIGQKINVTFLGNGQFSMQDNTADQKTFKRGQLVIARYVKLVKGRGITVQINSSTFGFIEVCEITDDISGNVFKFLQKKSVFAARVIDHDKNGKIQLSTRESVIDSESWNTLKPEGTTIKFQSFDKINQDRGNQRNKILKFGASIALKQGDLALGYIVNIGKAGCFVQIGHNTVVRAGLNELSDDSSFNFSEDMPIGRIVLGRVYRIDNQSNGEKRFHFSTRQSIVVYSAMAVERKNLQVDQEVEAIIMAMADGKSFAQIKGSYVKIKVKGYTSKDKLQVGDHVFASLKKVTKEKISSEFVGRISSSGEKPEMSAEERQAQSIYLSVKEEAEKDIESIKELNNQKVTEDFDATLIDQRNFLDKEAQIAQQIQDLNELDKDDEDEEMPSDDSDAEDMKRIINYDDDEEMEGEESGEQESDEEMNQSEPEDDSSQSEDEEKPKKSKKRTLKERIMEEQKIRDKEQRMRSGEDKPQDIDDYERLLVSQQDQSYLWIQYMAFMLDNVGIDAARKVVERGVKAVGMSNDEDKLNLWTAFMNLESNFGTQETLESCTRRALEVNDRKKVYMNLIDIYKTSMKFGFAEIIYKQLSKKYGNSLEIWTAYLEFLIEMKQKQEDETQKFVVEDTEFSDPKSVLQRSLQALTKDQHVAMISKYGMLEFKYGNPENGRTMFEGIVSNYPKRMDIWSIYMDMELKYGQGNVTQARHLFERCLNSEYIQKKPKKMKLVFQKYMEYENKQGNKNNLAKLRERVEAYLSKFYDEKKSDGEDSDEN